MATLTALRDAVERAPHSAHAVYEHGVALIRRGEFPAAFADLRRAIELQPQEPLFHHALGYLLSRWPGAEEETTRHLERAVALAPESPGACEELAWQYAAVDDRPVDACRLSARVIAVSPERARAYVHLCRACVPDAEGEALWTIVQRWLPPNGRRSLLRYGLARALTYVGRYGEALTCLSDASKEAPLDAQLLALLAQVQEVLGDFATARESCEQALRLAPGDAGIIEQYRSLLGRLGDYATIRRTLRSETALRALDVVPSARVWEPACVHGRTVLLANSGGYGDNLLWPRIAARLRDAGARVLVECQAPLKPLVATMTGVDAAVAPHDDYPPYDMECRSSLALQMADWEWADMRAQVPYVQVPAAARDRWRARRAEYTGLFHVGLAWRTETDKMAKDDPYLRRSVPFADLGGLRTVPGAVYHSLHVGVDGLRELRAQASSLPVTELSSAIDDFIDTAGAVTAVDAVVTVDTAIAHVAGALDKPVLLVLPYRGDWRWGEPETPAQWYPSCRVFRQRTPGAWAPVIDEVAAALRAMHHRATAP